MSGRLEGWAAMCVNYLAVVPLLSLHLCVDELVGWFHGIHVWLGIAGNHVVKLESEGEEPAVDIWVGEKQKQPHGVSGPQSDTSQESSLELGCSGAG